MPDPLYSSRWTQLYTVTPDAGGRLILDGVVQDGSIGKSLYISGFMVETAGTVTVIGKDGGASQVLTVLAGVKYDIACRSVLAVSGTGAVFGGR